MAANAHAAPKPPQHNLKMMALTILVFQSTSLVLFMRYTRTVSEGPVYRSSTAVFLAEILKVLVCCYIVLKEQNYNFAAARQHIRERTIDVPWDTSKLAIPSGLYALQNNLLYVALSNLEPAVYQVTYQLKVLTTALFSVALLGRTLRPQQWFSLFLLMAGVVMVQLQVNGASKAAGASDDDEGMTAVGDEQALEAAAAQSPLLGLIMVLMACCTSGFAGVYFEKMLKGAKATVWIRNIQLGMWGILFSGVMMMINDGEGIMRDGLLYGYTWQVWAVVVQQALGGLVVAMVIKYADNILKGFAMSLSVILSSVVSMVLFDFEIGLQFTIGSAVVLASVFLYSQKPKETAGPRGSKLPV